MYQCEGEIILHQLVSLVFARHDTYQDKARMKEDKGEYPHSKKKKQTEKQPLHHAVVGHEIPEGVCRYLGDVNEVNGRHDQ